MRPDAVRYIGYINVDVDLALLAAERAAATLSEGVLLVERATNLKAQELYGNVQTAIDALHRAKALGKELSP